MNTIDEIKSRLDIVDLVSETVKLRRAGKNYTGFCPFHPNSRTPAFVVFPDSGTWRCFGQCNEGGDIFRFVMKKEGWDFSQTLKFLAEKAGVQLVAQTPEVQQAREENDRLRSLLEDAAAFYKEQLYHTPAGQVALDYLHQRGLQDAVLNLFGLGYAPASWEMTFHHLTARGYSQDDVSRAGMLSEREGGGFYDRFRNRIMIPIRDMNGGMAGFGARVLDPNDVPKFLNSPQTPLFDKGRILYALDQARKPIRSLDQAVIVEGYMDVIALHQAGFNNVVSPMGTALTEDQLRLLKRFSRRIILALDADAAGQKATLRGLETARQAMDHAEESFFDARGLVHTESRLQADLRVTTLPEGLDPDEVVARDPQEWQRLVEDARPIVVHVMETLASGQDINDAKVKSHIAAQVLPLVEDVQDPVERETYRQRLAHLLRIDERALISAQAVPARVRRSRGSSASQAGVARRSSPKVLSPSSGGRQEEYLLGALVQRPELLHLLDRALQEAGLLRLDSSDFNRTDHQMIYTAVRAAVEQAELDPGHFITSQLEGADGAVAERARSLGATPLPQVSLPELLVEDLARAQLLLRKGNTQDRIGELQFQIAEAQDQGDLRAAELVQQVIVLSQLRDRLDRALKHTLTRH